MLVANFPRTPSVRGLGPRAERRLERIFSVARTSDIPTVLSKADDIDMQGRALAKLGLDPRLTIGLFCSSILSLSLIDSRKPRT